MSLFSRLFGGNKSATENSQAEEYNGCRIYSEPAKAEGGYRIGARIEKDFGDQTKTHQLIRADVISSPDEARTTSLNKAKQVIDQLGDSIFD